MEVSILSRLTTLGLKDALLLCDPIAARHIMFLGLDRLYALGCALVGDLDFDPSKAVLSYSKVIVLRGGDTRKLPLFSVPVIEARCYDHQLKEKYKRPSGENVSLFRREEVSQYCPLVTLVSDDFGLLEVPDSCAGPRGNDVGVFVGLSTAIDLLGIDPPHVYFIGSQVGACAEFFHENFEQSTDSTALIVIDRRLDLVSVSVPSDHVCDPAEDDWAWLRRTQPLDPAIPGPNGLLNVQKQSGPIDELWKSIGKQVSPNCLRNKDFGSYNEEEMKKGLALLVACAASVPQNALMREVALPLNVPYPPLLENTINEIRDSCPFQGTMDSFVARALMGDLHSELQEAWGNVVTAVFSLFGRRKSTGDPLRNMDTIVFFIYGGITIQEIFLLSRVREQLADGRRVIFLATQFARPDLIATDIFSSIW